MYAHLVEENPDTVIFVIKREVLTAASSLISWCSAPEGATRMVLGERCPTCGGRDGSAIAAITERDYTFRCSSGHTSSWPELTYRPVGFYAMVRDTRRGSDDDAG